MTHTVSIGREHNFEISFKEKKTKTVSQPITNKLKQLLEKKTERISLNASPNLSIDVSGPILHSDW